MGTKKKNNGQGCKPVVPLRFSKNGNAGIEKAYATHFVDVRRIEQFDQSKKEGEETV